MHHVDLYSLAWGVHTDTYRDVKKWYDLPHHDLKELRLRSCSHGRNLHQTKENGSVWGCSPHSWWSQDHCRGRRVLRRPNRRGDHRPTATLAQWPRLLRATYWGQSWQWWRTRWDPFPDRSSSWLQGVVRHSLHATMASTTYGAYIQPWLYYIFMYAYINIYTVFIYIHATYHISYGFTNQLKTRGITLKEELFQSLL